MTGTIGAVALDQSGRLAAGTSTGGKGFERIGRVSDSAMPAGTYAAEVAAVSCTGIGEDIVDECAAARIVVRVTDGHSLAEAFELAFREAARRSRQFGAIGISKDGMIAWGRTGSTTRILLGAYHDGREADCTLGWCVSSNEILFSVPHRAGNGTVPKLIIHGGISSRIERLADRGGRGSVERELRLVIEEVYRTLTQGLSAIDAVTHACELLENCPIFNAGTGSVLQSDGQIRMSASLMDGVAQRFSGVINVSRVPNPIALAQRLQSSDDRVLSDYGAAELARELSIAPYDPLTELRLNEWIQETRSRVKG